MIQSWLATGNCYGQNSKCMAQLLHAGLQDGSTQRQVVDTTIGQFERGRSQVHALTVLDGFLFVQFLLGGATLLYSTMQSYLWGISKVAVTSSSSSIGPANTSGDSQQCLTY